MYDKTPQSLEDDDTTDLRAVLSATWARKWFIVKTTLAFAVLFLVLVTQVTPHYTARSSVMLDPRSVQVLSSDEVVSELTLNNPLLDTEVSVLRSNILLEEVLANLDPALRAKLDPLNTEPSAIGRIAGSIKAVLGSVASVFTAEDTTSVSTVSAEDSELRRLVVALRRSLTVWREGQSYLISVSVETPDPVLSTVLANAITQTYIDRQVADRRLAVRGATDFLQQRVDALRSEVERAEAVVGDFRINQLAQSGLSQTTIDQQMLDLSTQLALARAEQAQAQARFSQIQAVIDADGFNAAADVLTSTLVVSLRQQLAELGREMAELTLQLSPDHPDRQRLNAQIELTANELQFEVQKIVATMRNDVEVASSRTVSLQSSLTELENRSADISRTSIQLRQLEREAEAIRENYQSMLNRLNETRSTEQLQRADAKLVERAVVPGAPSSPRVLLLTTFGAALGLTIGLIGVFVMAVSNVGFKTSAQLEENISIPVMGSLFEVDWRGTIWILQELRLSPYGLFAERIRQLRNSIAFSLGRKSEEATGMCVLVTSCTPNESKTTTVLSLAQVEAFSNRSCVVLDLDLRQSNLARTFNYETRSDLSDVLLSDAPLSDAMFTPDEVGFDLLTLRAPMPQLMDLVPAERWQTLVSSLKARYDLVLIDTAPYNSVSDTQRFVELADFALLMVRQGVTRRRAVRETVQKLKKTDARYLGAAMSFVDPKSESDAYGLYGSY